MEVWLQARMSLGAYLQGPQAMRPQMQQVGGGRGGRCLAQVIGGPTNRCQQGRWAPSTARRGKTEEMVSSRHASLRGCGYGGCEWGSLIPFP